MTESAIKLQAGTLLQAVIERSRHALACGAMQPIETSEEFLEDEGVRFIVRKVSSLLRKERQRIERDAGAPANPFLDYDPALLVAEISGTHVALLNKFNVLERHLLIVTRRFKDQETLLERDDFSALAACIGEFDSLGFYNGGEQAGASQPHKHLQLVPLPLGREGPPVPVDPLFEKVRGAKGALRVPALPFRHAFAWIEPGGFGDAHSGAKRLLALYLGLLDAAGLKGIESGGEARQSAPYNLLLTRRWMLLVPRAKEHFDSISLNALAFAGSLFVRDDAQLEVVKRAGPMQMLKAVVSGSS